MKKHYLLSLIVFFAAATLATAQFSPKRRPYTTEQKREIFKKSSQDFSDDIFKIKEVPEKWQNESIVILAKKTKYKAGVNAFNSVGTMFIYQHIRVKLNDQAAVQAFSEYTFQSDDIVEITIEKADGKKEKVNLDDAIPVKREVNDLYIAGLSFSYTAYKKMAIAGLEPGDIVNVTSFDGERFNRNYYHWSDPLTFWFNPLFIIKLMGVGTEPAFHPNSAQTLADDYPVVAQKIEFDLGKCFYLNFYSLNGAPSLKKEKKKGGRGYVWVFEDEMRDKLKEEAWSTPMASLPSIKYSIEYVRRKHRRRTHKLIDRKDKLKEEVTQKDLKKIARRFIKESKQFTGNIYFDFYKKEGKKIKDKGDFVKAFYNYYRTTKLIEVASRTEKPYDAAIANKNFVQYLVKIMRKEMIPYKLIMGVPASRGSIDNILSESEIIWGVLINIRGEDMIFTDCDYYASAGEVNPKFEDIKLYLVTPAASWRGIKLAEYDLSPAPPKNNTYSFTITAEFMPDWDTVLVKRKTSLTGMAQYPYKKIAFSYEDYYGQLKERAGNNSLLFVTRYLYDAKLYNDKRFLEEEEERLTNSVLERIDKNKREINEADLSGDFYMVSYDKFKVVQDGIKDNKAEIVFEEEFKMRDLLDDLGDGNTYVLKIGEFIDRQIEIKDIDERERQTDIRYPYARIYTYFIEITLPPGLEAQSLSDLNREAENETGSFKSTATLQGNKLVIKVEKIYKGKNHDKSKWGDVLNFIDEAVDFRNAKIILKRK